MNYLGKFLIGLAFCQIVIGEAISQEVDPKSTVRRFGTLMIYGTGHYRTDLSKDLITSQLKLRPGVAFYILPQVAVGLEGRYNRNFSELEDPQNPDKPDEALKRDLRFGPRAYVFMGGRRSSFTPYLIAGADYIINDRLLNGEETWSENLNLGITAGGGVMLNLNKNVALSTEVNFDYDLGENPEDVEENINTQQFVIAFKVWGFLGN